MRNARLCGMDATDSHQLLPDENCIALELWRYNSVLLSNDKLVDPFSLWLSFKNEDNERLDIVLDELSNQFWNK
ncbi:MAG: hypothetical protein HQL46_12385 [Gammaproteobacteria bacterium]|nr:hypothetical protein [Gammaproteobacteria bacterium]